MMDSRSWWFTMSEITYREDSAVADAIGKILDEELAVRLEAVDHADV